jgi:two-component system LytT family response regulator
MQKKGKMEIMLRILIADDDEGIRTVLKKAIGRVEGYEEAGEASDGESFLRIWEDERPDVVFLDVEMPVVSGIECARKIVDIDPGTIIIFATGHQEYMPEAFENYAFDYIVKPFKIERILKTLERIKLVRAEFNDVLQNRRIKENIGLKKLVLRGKEGVSFLDTSSIILIQRENRSTVIYTKDESYTTSEGLSELEEKLDSNVFLRGHKSYIINLSMISKIYPYGRWTYIVKLHGTDKDALLTHDKFEEVKRIFEM